MDSSTARNAILASIRSACSVRPDGKGYAAIPREYFRVGYLETPARLNLFAERLHEYDAEVHFASAGELAEMVGAILKNRGKQRMLIPAGIEQKWLPGGIEFTRGDELAPRALDTFDGVLTACSVAIALTGTIVLQNAPGQGPRSLSLVPDYHLCVVREDQVVETVPEAMEWLKATEKLPTTFISGPSATADIEMTRIKGVHGPRVLDILVARPG